MQLAVLRRARFGRSSEKLDRAIEQLELLIGELEEEVGAAEARDAADDPAASKDAKAPVKPRARKHAGPQAAAAASAARDRHPRAGLHLPGLRRHGVQPHRPGRARGARIRPVQLQGDPPCPARS